MSPVKAIPEGFHTVTPYLCIQGADEALDFYKKALGAEEIFRFAMPDGRIGHAEIKIGDSIIMLADEFPEMGFKGPKSLGGTPCTMHLYVSDVDKSADRAVKAGMEVLRPVADQFYGDRSGTFKDPFGHQWSLSTHQEDVAPEELGKRMEEWSQKEKKS